MSEERWGWARRDRGARGASEEVSSLCQLPMMLPLLLLALLVVILVLLVLRLRAPFLVLLTVPIYPARKRFPPTFRGAP